MGQILIGDAQPLHRTGLIALLAEINAGEVSVAEDFGSVLRALEQRLATGVVLLDFELPGMGGLHGMGRLRACFPRLFIVGLSADVNREQVLDALSTGLHGVIPKTLSKEELMTALRAVCDRQIYVPTGLCEASKAPAAPFRRASPPTSTLTGRQQEVLDLVALGRSNKEIGRALGITEGTVKVHITAGFRQLGVRNRTSAAAALLARGYQSERRDPHLPGVFPVEGRLDPCRARETANEAPPQFSRPARHSVWVRGSSR